jgi:hypothetical protein
LSAGAIFFCATKHFRVWRVILSCGVIDRYSRPQMRDIWSDQRKFQIWLEIELLACEAMAELGQIPKQDAAEIRKRARFSIPEILEIEKRTNHDVIAFLKMSPLPLARLHVGSIKG